MTPEPPDRAFRLAHEYGLSELETKVFLRLWQGPATLGELFDAMYGNREDGGPLCGEDATRQIYHRLKKKLDHQATFCLRHEFEMKLHRNHEPALD